jgi:hypothetical protein
VGNVIAAAMLSFEFIVAASEARFDGGVVVADDLDFD